MLVRGQDVRTRTGRADPQTRQGGSGGSEDKENIDVQVELGSGGGGFGGNGAELC